MRRILAGLLIVASVVVGAGTALADGDGAYIITIETAKGRFRALVTDPDAIQRAKQELAGGDDAGIAIGPLAYGHGGVNRGHRWHLTDFAFADFTMELCDGTAKAVDRDVKYWVETVGSFCPWSTRVVSLRPVR